MAVFNLEMMDQLESRGLKMNTLDKLYSLDGIAIYPPPEEARINDSYRVTVKQVAAGQVADKGGIGGCQIVINGKVPWAQSGWLRTLQEHLAERADDEEFIVLYDPINRRSYECVATASSIAVNVMTPHFFSYEIKLAGQVLGYAWLTATPVEETTTEAVEAFDLASLGWIYDDMEFATIAYEDSMNKLRDGGIPAGSGNQQPTSTDDVDTSEDGKEHSPATEFKTIGDQVYVTYGGKSYTIEQYQDLLRDGMAEVK